MTKKLNCIAFVFARGGSKGIPKKNLALLLGKPLIAYSIEIAKACPFIGRVIVSTDNQEIADVAIKYGAEVPFIRPKELAKDHSREWQAWQHAIQFVQHDIKSKPMDIFVSLPPTSPLRSVEDVEHCIKELVTTNADIVITVKEAERNPYFNMIQIDNHGFSRLVLKPDFSVSRRQEAPCLYDMTTVAYVAKPEFILRAKGIFDGRVRSVLIPRERAIDIDNKLDLKMAEVLIKESL